MAGKLGNGGSGGGVGEDCRSMVVLDDGGEAEAEVCTMGVADGRARAMVAARTRGEVMSAIADCVAHDSGRAAGGKVGNGGRGLLGKVDERSRPRTGDVTLVGRIGGVGGPVGVGLPGVTKFTDAAACGAGAMVNSRAVLCCVLIRTGGIGAAALCRAGGVGGTGACTAPVPLLPPLAVLVGLPLPPVLLDVSMVDSKF